MESKKRQMKPILLPNYFKRIGLSILVLAPLIAVLVKSTAGGLTLSQRGLLYNLTLDALILGLFCIAWSRDKIEDEMTILLRLRVMAIAFSWGAIYTIVMSVIYWADKELLSANMSSQQLILTMLVVYLVWYYSQKWRR